MKIPTININVKSKRQKPAFKHLMFIHWAMVPCFLFLYVTGVILPHISREFTLSNTIPFLHQSFGILIMLFLIARIFLLVRIIGNKYLRRFPKITSFWLKTLIIHTSLYLFMALVPISGLLLRNLRGIDTTFFGIFVPYLIFKNEGLVESTRNLHFLTSYIFLCFIVLHIFSQKNVNFSIKLLKS